MRESLGGEATDRVVADGRETRLEEAVAYALEVLAPNGRGSRLTG